MDAGKTCEKALQQKGVPYEFLCIDEEEGYLVEKNKWHKAFDLQLRVIGTPVALALDATAGLACLVISDPCFLSELFELAGNSLND